MAGIAHSVNLEFCIPPHLPLPSGSETALGRRPKGGETILPFDKVGTTRNRGGVRGDLTKIMAQLGYKLSIIY
jgi:hypothetical protein